MGVANSVWTARRPSPRRSGVVVGVAVAIVVTATVVVVLGFLAVDGRVPGVPALTLPGSGGGTDPVVVAPDGSDTTDPGSDEPETITPPSDEVPDVQDPVDGPDTGDGSVAAEDHGADVPADAPDADDTGDDTTDDTADDDPSLEELQQRLVELGYLVGSVDGRRGPQTVAAIMAFQRVHGLVVDGVVGPRTLEAFAGDPVEPTLAGGPDTRIEVDLDAQLLHVVEDGERTVTFQVSSGNGGTYRSASGGTARARTPVGEFVVQRTIDGVRRSRLGTLYDPLYFYGGFAIHGSNSVPPYPASHGCVRITRADARWLTDRVDVGASVHLYGGVHVFSPSR